MAASLTKAVLLVLRPSWLTGPIFEKELRVSARRRRSYALRFFYVLLLAFFVALVWASVAGQQGGVTFQRSRMSVAGMRIVRTVVYFQFAATQFLAVVMLSTAISDEVYHRTLGLLMTTPITGLQVVMGKVLSKLLQLVLLLAITLPILAIVRIFGGVPWNYLLSSCCITLTAALFAGSVSLLISVENRRAYGVILRTGVVLLCFYVLVPLVLAVVVGYVILSLGALLTTGPRVPSAWLTSIVLHLNPYYALHLTTSQMMGSSPAGLGFSWPIHCAIMGALSVLVLAWSATVVRRVALHQVTGRLDPSRKNWQAGRKPAAGFTPVSQGAVKRVIGPAVVWKELRAPFIQGVDNRNSYVGLAATVIVLIGCYVSAYLNRTVDEEFWHVSYGLLFVFIGVLATAVFAATRVTTEKESQTWSLLLATPLADRDILLGKAVSAFRRCLPIWGLLAGHVLLFALVGYIHPVAVLHLVLLVTWLTCFITGAGLYFSVRFSRTTSAVLACFGLLLALWAVGPILAGWLNLLSARDGNGPFADYMLTHPAIQTELILAGAGGSAHGRAALGALRYGERSVLGFALKPFGVGRMTLILAITAMVYIGAGAVLFFLAQRRLRQNVF